MEDTMLELLEVCRQKEIYCMHNDVDDLIESALNSKLLLINLKSQRLDKKKQEVKNIIKQPTNCRTLIAIAPVLPTEEPKYFLSMGDEHLSTILEMELGEVIKSSVKNLVLIPKSLLNRDTLFDSSPKFDYLLKEFSCELAHINLIPPRIEEADFDLEEEIRLVENLLYDNSFPRPSDELNAEITDTIVKSLSKSPIPVEDSNSQMDEIDLFLATDDLMPSGIEYDDYDSKGEIHFLEELLSNYTLPLPKNESSNFDHHDDPSFFRPPPEPPDVKFFFDFEPNTGVLTAKVLEDISEHHVLRPKFLPSQPTLCPNIDTLLPFSFENEDKVFKPESLLNRDTLFDSSPKFDYLLEEFSGELAHINPISSGIKEADFDLEEEIRLVENLLYDNSFPRPSDELNAEINDTIVKSLSSSPIPVEDSNSQMDEIDLFIATDDLMPPGIEYDDYDSEGDIHFLEELLSNDNHLLPKNESSNFDHHDDPSFLRPPLKPPDVKFFFDFEPNTGVLTAKVLEDISEHHVLMPKVLPSQPTLCPNIDTLLLFSSKNEDKVFKHDQGLKRDDYKFVRDQGSEWKIKHASQAREASLHNYK
nr:hypothetical protein [Tanacetum cinerariifolium]